MGLSKLCKECRECKYKETCNHKRMEAFAFIQPMASNASQPMSVPMAQPMLQAHDYIDIKIAECTTITIDIEEIKSNISKSIYERNCGIFRSAT